MEEEVLEKTIVAAVMESSATENSLPNAMPTVCYCPLALALLQFNKPPLQVGEPRVRNIDEIPDWVLAGG